MNWTESPEGAGLGARILREGYGSGAWHGPDLKTALAGTTADLAVRRPAPGRHSIAEIAIHHAYYLHSARGRLRAASVEPFAIAGDDWFAVSASGPMAWPEILNLVERQQRLLDETVRAVDAGTAKSPLSAAERFDLVLGITCHAVYHAGQVQLIRRLFGA